MVRIGRREGAVREIRSRGRWGGVEKNEIGK